MSNMENEGDINCTDIAGMTKIMGIRILVLSSWIFRHFVHVSMHKCDERWMLFRVFKSLHVVGTWLNLQKYGNLKEPKTWKTDMQGVNHSPSP